MDNLYIYIYMMYGLYMDNLWMIFLDMVDLLSGKLIELLNMTEPDS